MKVAICIASYNRGEFLPELFDSIHKQTFGDYHIYIGYDGSTDDSLDVIETYKTEIGMPITIVDYIETARIGLNKHRVVERALEDDPELIQMLDSDDMIEPTFLERSVGVIGDYDWLLSWGRCFGTREGTIEGKITPFEELIHKNMLHSWGMFKTDVLREHNYREKLDFAEDWNLWIRLTKAGYKGVILEEHLYLQRWHDSNLNVVHQHDYAAMRGRVLEGLLPIDRPYRFHLLGLVHLPVSELYMSCAFTQKIVKLAKMLTDIGHEVVLYGAEGSDAPCTEFVQTHTLADIRETWGNGDNRFDIGYDWHTNGFRHDFNAERKPVTHKFNKAASDHITRVKRKDDFLLLMQGQYQRQVADAAGLYLTCEPGIGYRGSYCDFRAFESAYLMNFTLGSANPFKSVNGSYYWRVIPNYFDEKDFPFQEKKKDYFFFIGRMINRKGVMTAIRATNAIGAKLILAGQLSGEVDPRKLPSNCEFIGHVGPEERAKLMGGAKAVFVPTLYLEAFGGVNVEAQLCGTPVITTNFGVFPETVVHGETGFLCNTLQDFVDAAERVSYLDPQVIRTHAERYLMKNVVWDFQKWWDDLYTLYQSIGKPSGTIWGWNYLKKDHEHLQS